MYNWLLLLYKVPTEPTARRVYVWRKLKRLGAVLLHDAAWVLPATARTREHFQWLAAEINEMGGTAVLLESRFALADPEEELVQRFRSQAESAYSEILAELEKEDPDLPALARRYQQVLSQDYFQSELGARVRRALAAKGGIE